MDERFLGLMTGVGLMFSILVSGALLYDCGYQYGACTTQCEALDLEGQPIGQECICKPAKSPKISE